MAGERQRHTQKARLHGYINKDGHYQEVSTVFILLISNYLRSLNSVLYALFSSYYLFLMF